MKLLTYLLIFSLLLLSCTAPKHLGTTSVQKPSMKEPDKEVWFTYWEDQLDGSGGYVPAPFSSEYPPSAIEGYNKAKVEWDTKVQQAKLGNACLLGAGGIGLIVFGTMILINDVENDINQLYDY